VSTSIEEELDKEWVSCVAIDIDNLGRIANKYGDLMVRNLSRAVGLRILGQFHASIRKPETYKLYHVSGDRFYILMKGIDSDQSLQDAQRLRDALAGSYHIAGLRSSIEPPILPEGMTFLSDITVRLAVTSYKYSTLLRILTKFAQGRSDAAAIIEVRRKVSSTLDDVLKLGMDKGGNVVMAWNHKRLRFVAHPPKNAAQPGSSNNEEPIPV
jgi:GGDEF domain-containing protein